MGCEWNADVVRMVSYAPLLAHVNGRSGWHGMIYFDSLRACGTVWYHLRKLFGLNRPDYTVATDVRVEFAAKPSIAGAIGVGTWNTAAEFKDIRVEKDGQVLYASDFAREAKGWRKESGSWSVAEGAWRQQDNVVGVSLFGDDKWTDYTLTLKARKLSGAEGFLIVFGRKSGDQYWWNIGGWGNREHGIEFNRTPVGRHVAGKIELNRWYDIQVQLEGRRIRSYLDGQLVHDQTAPSMDRFFALAGRDEASGEVVLKAINTATEPMRASLDLRGLERFGSEAKLTVLSSADPQANNSLDHPTKVVPVSRRIAAGGKRLSHEFPPLSLTVVWLMAK